MRLAVATSLALAASPYLAAAAAGKQGFALGTKLADGSCKKTPDYELDFDAITKETEAKIVRGYSASDCDFVKNVLPAAKSKGFQVVLGIWPDVPESFNKDIAAIKDNVADMHDQVYAITVGSETLYRGNFTGPELADKIDEVKQQLPGFKYGTADSWNFIANGTADAVISRGVDLMLVNGFAFWQGTAIKDAQATYLTDMVQAYNHIRTTAGDKAKDMELWNGETGWPTDGGSDFQAAAAGTKNAEDYYHNSFCVFIGWGYNAFYFEAFDEPWKPDSIGDNGLPANEKHWGAMEADRSSKFNLKCFGS